MSIVIRTDDAPESENAVRADVQNLWRKRGWRPPKEYRRDFAQLCRPPFIETKKARFADRREDMT